MPKQRIKRRAGKQHNPLDTDIMDARHIVRRGRREYDDEADDGIDVGPNSVGVMNPKMTSRLFDMAREQRAEVAAEQTRGNDEEDSNDAEEDEEDYDEELEFDDHSSQATEMTDLDPLVPDLDDDEAAALAQFQPKNNLQCRTLADVILAKINEHKARKEGCVVDEDEDNSGPDIDPKIARVYRAVGKLLKSYTHGRLPKAFKVLPRLANWEELLWLTKPQDWSPMALYMATRLFASGLNEAMAQRYYYTFLLPSIVAAMETPKSEAKLKLHPWRFNAIRKAIFKPAAFVKGFLVPLCEESSSIQLALIVGTIIHKCTIPVIPAAIGLVKISEMEFSSVNAIVMRAIIDKRLNLPVQAVDAMVSYFHKFVRDDRNLPVLWHQLLLTFLDRYGHEIDPAHLPLIRDVCHKHFHSLITPEVHKLIQRLERK
eukprot:PhM_4_TR11188/c0_g1_i1/m.13801/K14797/ENP1, BYSL; essential nuclear protein 1